MAWQNVLGLLWQENTECSASKLSFFVLLLVQRLRVRQLPKCDTINYLQISKIFEVKVCIYSY